MSEDKKEELTVEEQLKDTKKYLKRANLAAILLSIGILFSAAFPYYINNMRESGCIAEYSQQLDGSMEFIRTADFKKLNEEDKKELSSSLKAPGLCSHYLSHNKMQEVMAENAEKIEAIRSFLQQ